MPNLDGRSSSSSLGYIYWLTPTKEVNKKIINL